MYNNDKIIEKRMKEKQNRIDKAIAMKEKQIAYFNSLNAAIARCPDGTLEEIIEWRDLFLKEWREWYLKETTPQPVDFDEAQEKWDEHKQKLYNKESEDDENRKIQAGLN